MSIDYRGLTVAHVDHVGLVVFGAQVQIFESSRLAYPCVVST